MPHFESREFPVRWREIVAGGRAPSFRVPGTLTSYFVFAGIGFVGSAGCAVQAFEGDRQKTEAELERSKNVLEGERAEVQRARGDLDRFSARVSF